MPDEQNLIDMLREYYNRLRIASITNGDNANKIQTLQNFNPRNMVKRNRTSEYLDVDIDPFQKNPYMLKNQDMPVPPNFNDIVHQVEAREFASQPILPSVSDLNYIMENLRNKQFGNPLKSELIKAGYK